MIILKVFFSSSATIVLFLLMHLVWGGSLVLWLLAGWVASGPVVLAVFLLHDDTMKSNILVSLQKKLSTLRSKQPASYDQ